MKFNGSDALEGCLIRRGGGALNEPDKLIFFATAACSLIYFPEQCVCMRVLLFKWPSPSAHHVAALPLPWKLNAGIAGGRWGRGQGE